MPLLYVLVVALLGIVVWRDILAARERKDLLNRIMARDYAEYLRANSAPPSAVPYSDVDEYARELNQR